MPGPMVAVETQTAAVGLDVNRTLTLGVGARLEFYVPDQQAEGGMRLVRAYTSAFDRVPEAERERGDGRSVVFDIADVFPAGQVAADLGQKDLYLRWVEFDAEGAELPSEFCKVNEVPRPAAGTAQVWRVTAMTRTFKQTYFGIGRS